MNGTILFSILIIGTFALGAFVFWLHHKEIMAIEENYAKRREPQPPVEFKYETTVTTKKETPE